MFSLKTIIRIQLWAWIAAGCLPVLPVMVAAQEGWLINGSNTTRGTVYDAHGSGTGSPYPSEGDMFYNEFNLYLNKQNSNYDTWRGEFSGVYNANDDYRSPDFGLVPERLNLTRENGESSIPYRVEAGDLFSYYSYLSLQRSLKGVQLELQPGQSNADRQHSIVLTSGANESNWRDLTFNDNYFNGLSWLMQDVNWGAWSLNLVHNYRDGSFKQGSLDRNQYVFSLAGEKNIVLESHRLTFEGEAAHFSGDHNGTSGAASGQDRSDNGYYLEMRGNHDRLPWDYRVRFDYYGQDFRPTGAVVTPDRRSVETHTSWRFESAIRMRARAQLFEDGFETTNKTRTRTYGINFTGPLLKTFYPDVYGNLDAHIQNQDNEAHTLSPLTQTISLNLSKPLPQGWSGRLGVFIQNVNDSVIGNADRLTRQVNISADHAFSFAGLEGFITPGILLRSVRKGGADTDDWSPTLAVRMNQGPHALTINYNSLLQDRHSSSGGTDVDTHTLNVDYRYQYRQHQIGVEANLFGRDPQVGESTEAYKISLFWTMTFDKPMQLALGRRVQPEIGTGISPSGREEMVIDLWKLLPGLGLDRAIDLLEDADISGGIKQAGYEVYEYPVLQNVFQRQRLVLKETNGILNKTALIIEFEDVGNRDTVLQTFERVRQTLIRQWGNPSRNYEQGDFTTNFIADINDQRLIRVTEWTTPGGVIRFGIPRRLDGQVRMEIQYGISFPPPRDTLWSIEAVR